MPLQQDSRNCLFDYQVVNSSAIGLNGNGAIEVHYYYYTQSAWSRTDSDVDILLLHRVMC